MRPLRVALGLVAVAAGALLPLVVGPFWLGLVTQMYVFGLLALEELGADDPRVTTALTVIAVTVVLSVVAHGASARPLAERYERATAAPSPPGGAPPG